MVAAISLDEFVNIIEFPLCSFSYSFFRVLFIYILLAVSLSKVLRWSQLYEVFISIRYIFLTSVPGKCCKHLDCGDSEGGTK